MNYLRYLKSENPKVVKSTLLIKSDLTKMLEGAKAICAKFDAVPVISQCVQCFTFHGMRLNNFDSREDKNLWTKPDKNHGFLSRPRTRVTGLAAKVKTLNHEFREAMDGATIEVSKDDLYNSLGSDWGNMILYGGVSAFVLDGCAWLKTRYSNTLENCVEITCSEYEQAYEKYKAGEL